MNYSQLNKTINPLDFVNRERFDPRTLLSKDDSYPKITIVTPSFNQAKFLEMSILSVLNQNYPNLEYIIIDGKSSDDSVKIIKKYEKYLAYWVSEKDAGQADALRKGFSISTGRILAWLNSDDIYLEGALKRVAKEFQESPSDVLYGDEYLIDESSAIVGMRPQLRYPKRLGPMFFVYGGFWIYQPAAFWRSDLYHQVGGVDPSYRFAMDNDLFIRFALAGARFRRFNKYVVSFRYHDASKTCTIEHVAVQENRGLIQKYGQSVHKALRSTFLSKNLGRIYQISGHLLSGRVSYVFEKYWYTFLQKLGFNLKIKYF